MRSGTREKMVYRPCRLTAASTPPDRDRGREGIGQLCMVTEGFPVK